MLEEPGCQGLFLALSQVSLPLHVALNDSPEVHLRRWICGLIIRIRAFGEWLQSGRPVGPPESRLRRQHMVVMSKA